MSRLKLGLLCVALLMVFGVASAQEAPKWSYVEAGFINFDPDSGVSDDGWYAGGLMSLFKNFHLVAEYDDVGDYTFWNVGGGWHGLLGDPGDLFAEILWNDVQVDSSGNNVSDDGYVVDGGVRWKFGKWFEAKGQVNWIDLDQGGSDTTFEAEGLIWLMNDRLGFGVNYESGDSDTGKLFARFTFGK